MRSPGRAGVRSPGSPGRRASTERSAPSSPIAPSNDRYQQVEDWPTATTRPNVVPQSNRSSPTVEGKRKSSADRSVGRADAEMGLNRAVSGADWLDGGSTSLSSPTTPSSPNTPGSPNNFEGSSPGRRNLTKRRASVAEARSNAPPPPIVAEDALGRAIEYFSAQQLEGRPLDHTQHESLLRKCGQVKQELQYTRVESRRPPGRVDELAPSRHERVPPGSIALLFNWYGRGM